MHLRLDIIGRKKAISTIWECNEMLNKFGHATTVVADCQSVILAWVQSNEPKLGTDGFVDLWPLTSQPQGLPYDNQCPFMYRISQWRARGPQREITRVIFSLDRPSMPFLVWGLHWKQGMSLRWDWSSLARGNIANVVDIIISNVSHTLEYSSSWPYSAFLYTCG